MKSTLWTFAATMVLAACTDHSHVVSHPGSGSDASISAEQDAQPASDADDPWQPVHGASADVNRYMEMVCRLGARCGSDTLSACRAGYEGFYCESAYATLDLPDLDACKAARDRDACGHGGPLPECFTTRRALREARGFATIVRSGEACDNRTARCDFDLICTAKDGECGTCTAPLKEGESCREYDRCGDQMYCSAKKVCTRPLPEGSACDEASDVCDFGFACKQGKCVVAKLGDYGDTCKSDEQCYAGFCMKGVCGGAVACGQGTLGDPCWNDATCGENLLCDVYKRRCVAQIADGKACDFNDPYFCSPRSHCDYADETGTTTTCQPKLKNGQECYSPGVYHPDSECASHLCNSDGKCAEPVSACK